MYSERHTQHHVCEIDNRFIVFIFYKNIRIAQIEHIINKTIMHDFSWLLMQLTMKAIS